MDGVTATTPFLEFRLWWRRASPGKQAAAVGALATALALVAWIAVPLGSGPSTTLGAGNGFRSGSATGATGATVAGGPTGGPSSTAGTAAAAGGGPATVTGPGGAVASGGAGGTASGGTGGAGSLAGCSGPAKTMNVGVTLINAGGLNNVFGVPTIQQQQGTWNAMIDSINKSGGAACQKLVPDYQTDDAFNPSSAQSACLAYVQHKDFAVLFGFLPQGPDTCMLQSHIPVFEDAPLSTVDAKQFYPDYFAGIGSYQSTYRNFAFAARQFNIFDPAHGFKKLGIFYHDCKPEVNQALLADLQAVGVPSSAIDRADLGCPSAFAPPSAIEQAVVKFKSDGVTTATIDNAIQDTQNITRTSQSQGFRPQWAIPDTGLVVTTGNPTFAPDPNNFDNALAITPEQYGANNMPGFKESPTDVQCDQIMTSHGQPGVMASQDQFSGWVCDTAWTFVAALNHAPSVAQDQLAAGLQRAGSVPFAFPYGPNNFSAPGTTWGGEFWRPITYRSSCRCWQTDNPNFQPPF